MVIVQKVLIPAFVILCSKTHNILLLLVFNQVIGMFNQYIFILLGKLVENNIILNKLCYIVFFLDFRFG